MVNVHKLGVLFSGETLFEDLSFQLGPGDRVGLTFDETTHFFDADGLAIRD